MSTVSNYYTQGSSQGQPSTMHYSSWTGSDVVNSSESQQSPQLYETYSSPPPPLSSLPLSPPPLSSPPLSPPPLSSPPLSPPLSLQPVASILEKKERSSDPNSTKLLVEHFKNNNNNNNNNNGIFLNDQNNEPIYQCVWFWSLILVILLIIGVVVYMCNKNGANIISRDGIHMSPETFGSGLSGMDNIVSGGILNDLEFL